MLFTINCTCFSREKKTKLFSLVFQKKTEQCDSGAWLHYSLKIPMRSKMLLLQSCGWAAKISGSYQAKLVLLVLLNTDMCGCSWTSPATTLPNNVLHYLLWERERERVLRDVHTIKMFKVNMLLSNLLLVRLWYVAFFFNYDNLVFNFFLVRLVLKKFLRLINRYILKNY